MKPEWRRFAPIGLYLAALAAVAALVLYILQREATLAVQVSLLLIVLGLALFALLDPQRLRQILTGRQARYGSNALILTIAFVGIVVVLNYFIYNNPQRWDLTEDKQFTLAPETLDTLTSMEEPVTANAFFTTRIPNDQARELLDQYKFYSDGKFDYEFIDPEANPVAAQQANVSRDGTVVLTMAGRQEPVTFVSEREMTGALIRLMNPEAHTVYFLTGHGEYSPEDTGELSYSRVKQTLESKNYAVKSLNLLTTNQIPDEAKLIVIPGPRKPLSSAEVDMLSLYLADGGALMVLQEPLPVTEFGDQSDPMADYLDEYWNIKFGDDIVLDMTSPQQPFAPFAERYANHAITDKMQRLTSQFPSARSVRASNAESGKSITELVLTSQQSWAETTMEGLAEGTSQVAFDEGEDTPGPIPLAVVGEDLETNARLVVFGDSDYAADANFIAYGNGDLFVNSVDWAVGQEELINLTPKDSTQRFLVTPQGITMNLLLLGVVIILPVLALIGGAVAYFQRRGRK